MSNLTVYRIYDPIEQKYCASGRGIYAKNGRSVWMSNAAAALALKNMPEQIRSRLVIKKFTLIEAKE